MFSSIKASIRRKVLLMQMTTIAIILLLASLLIIPLEISTFKQTEHRELQTIGQLIAHNAAPMLAFEDPEGGQRLLAGLSVRPNIKRACIYRYQGDLLAGYPNATDFGGPRLSVEAAVEGITYAKDQIRLIQHVRDREGAHLGVLLLEEDLSDLHRRILTRVVGLSLTFLFLGIGAFLVALRIQGMVTRPILDLATVADAVSDTQDYGLRARVWAQDELGHLVETFNKMLGKIENQDVQLTEYRDHLEQLVNQRTAELRKTNEALQVAKSKAEESSRAKSSFLSNMSHELRTPLNAILGYTQLMAISEDRSPQDRNQLDMILRAGDHLLGLINDVLTVARIEAQQQVLNPVPFDVRRFILGIEEMIRVRAGAKQLTFQVEVDASLQPVLVGDEGKLRQVLINLLGNAVKFTSEGGVALMVRCLATDRIYFEVRDTGAGIPPEEASGLFKAFFQTTLGKKVSEGTGLGLYLSQSIVALMGGEIRMESALDQGTRFYFDIPLPPGAALPQEPVLPQMLPKLMPGQPMLKQLVVDDNQDNRNLLSSLFTAMELPFAVAEDGTKAIDIWEKWRPDVIWMDMRMAGMDGFDATRLIRQREAIEGVGRPGGPKKTLILALTASVFEHDRNLIFECGCDDVLIKPYRVRDLLRMLSLHSGLRFVEEVAPQAPERATQADLQGALAKAPGAWRVALLEALELGETEKAKGLLDQLSMASPLVIEGLRVFLDEYHLDELEQMLRNVEGTS